MYLSESAAPSSVTDMYVTRPSSSDAIFFKSPLRYDGHGYPDGLVGEQIPISAQIVALADVYDALVSERSYKKAFSHETAVHMILNGECGAFNPLILDCLRSAADKILQIRYDVDVCLRRRDKEDAAANEADSAANTKKA